MTVKEHSATCISDSQFGLSDALARDVSLNLCLVNPIDAGPDKRSTNAHSPEGVSPQRVHVIASVREGKFKNKIILDS